MLEMARIQPGQRILDIAAGAGEPAVSAAERVGPGGHVLATDISEGIVELARQVAHERGLKQVETRAMDGEKLDLPDGTFAGGHVAVAVFSTPDRNVWGGVPASIIRQRAQLPPPVPGQPGPFSMGGPGVLEGIFQQAGFANLEIRAVPVPHRAATAAEYVQVAREAFGGFNAMMAQLPREERESVWNEVEDSLRSFESPDGFEAPGECLVVAAAK
jgi:SAM-dependent methyltransferase